MANLPKIALGAWAWGNDGTFGNNFTADSLRPIFDTAMKDMIEMQLKLIYVYAISRLTLLIEEPEGGVIPLLGFFR